MEARKVQRHVRGLMAGGHTADIPKPLLPKIQLYLETELENPNSQFTKSNLQKLLKDVIIIQKRLGLIKSNKLKHITHEKHNTTEIGDAKDIIAMVREGITPGEVNQTQLNNARNLLQSKIAALVDDGRLEDAQEYEDLMDSILAIEYGQVGVSVRQTKQASLEKQLHKLKEDRLRLKAQLAEDLLKCDRETEQQLNVAKSEQEKQLSEFDRETNEGASSWDRKFSGAVLELRRREQYLIKTRKFKEAAHVHREIEELEGQEEQEMQAKFIDKRMRERSRLELMYDRKYQWIRDFGNRVRQRIEVDGMKQVESVEQTIENTNKRIARVSDAISNVRIMTSPIRHRKVKNNSV